MVKIISSFSPKGGTGTSIMTVNIAIYLSQKGKKVLLMDASQNGGTLHSYLNIPHQFASLTIEDHFSVLPMVNTDFHNLKFFSNLRLGDSKESISDYFIRWSTEIKNSKFDYIFVDLGSIIDNDIIDFITITDLFLIFSAPDPVSIERTNHFMNSVFSHRLKLIEDKFNLHHLVQNIKRKDADIVFTPRNMLRLLTEAVPQYAKQIKEVVTDCNLGIIFNKIRSSSNSNIAETYPLISKNHFGFNVQNIGAIIYSEIIASSIYKMEPVVADEKSGEFLDFLGDIISTMVSAFSKDNRRNVMQNLSPLNFYEILGLDKGSSIYDIQRQYEKVTSIYDSKNPLIRGLFNEQEHHVYKKLIEHIYNWLIDADNRKEYDMDIENYQKSLLSSFPETFIIKDILKKYQKQRIEDPKLIQRDIYGRKAETKPLPLAQVDNLESNKVFEKYIDEICDGAILRKMREELDISVKYISEYTKISLFVIKAIEEDIYSQLPSPIYIKGFLKQYCSVLKLSKEYTEKVINDYITQISERNHGS